MKEFLEELKWQCTEGKAKGFYITISILLVCVMIGCVASLALMIINLVAYKAFSAMWLGLFVVTLIITIAIIVWMKKS